MLPLFRRSVGLALKIQLQYCHLAYQLLLQKPSQNPSAPSKTTLVGSPFGSLTLSYPEASHQHGDLKDVDHMVAVVHQPLVTWEE